MSNTLYENFVLEDKFESALKTKLDLNQFLTVNTTLTANPGTKIVINKRSAAGSAEDVDMGDDNTGLIEVDVDPEEYEVKVTQAKFVYYDEEEMTDPKVVDTGMTGLSEAMANDFTAKAIAEYEKATLIHEYDETEGIGFDDIVDAIALMNLEDEAGLFMLINPADKATLRKNLKDDLKYSEAFARTGYIGTVAGVPVSVSKAVTEGTAELATKEAVTAFIKKGSEIEQEREAGTRTNKVYARKVAVVALTDATKCVLIKPKGDDPEPDPDPDPEPEYVLTEDVTVQEGKDYYEKSGDTYTKVTPEGTEDPSDEGWYELVED